MKKTMIIGGNGNIGFAVATRFLLAGHEVTCFNRGMSGEVPEGTKLIVGDRRDRGNFEQTIRKESYDIAVDLTCYDADDAMSSARAFMNVGVLVHCSSVATYGRKLKKFPATEETPVSPENDYGRGKAEADRVILTAHLNTGLPAIIVKPAICYGPKFGLLRQLGQDLSWLSRIRNKRPILVSGDGIALHQFMHVNDVADAIYKLAEADGAVGEVFNIVNPQVISWEDYHLTAMAVIGCNVDQIGAPAKWIFSESAKLGHQVNDILSHNSFFSDRKLHNVTGFVPRITLLSGMKDVIDALEKACRLPRIEGGNWEDQLIKLVSGKSAPAHPEQMQGMSKSVATVLDTKSAFDLLLDELAQPVPAAPNEGRTVKLVEEGFLGLKYNLVRYLDRYWALHWEEGSFDTKRMLSGQSAWPVLIARSIEEIRLALEATVDRASGYLVRGFDAPAFFKGRHNLYLVDFINSDAQSDQIKQAPAYRNARIPLTDLFQPDGDEEIMIISPAPSRACNYRCSYCYHHDHGFNKNVEATKQWAQSILTAAEKIKRPIRFSAGAMGEPFFNSIWKETAIRLLERNNVRSLAAVSNLSMDPRPFLEKVDPSKLAIMASLHPSEFKDHDRDFKSFLDRLESLRDLGVSLVVNYVLTPDQVRQFPAYRSSITGLGIPMTSNVLRGPFKGKIYPEAFTEEEMKIVNSCYDENSFIFDSQSHYRNPYGLECISGRAGFYLEHDGILYNCHFARQRLGSVYDNRLMVRTANGFCTATKCESQTTIGWQVDVARRFKVQRTLHHYIKTDAQAPA